MGRWAEVYFTSPPENREQAVLELLHELEAGDCPHADATNPPTSMADQVRVPVAFLASRNALARRGNVDCQSCGRTNPASHRFCGMCGARLGEEEIALDLLIDGLPPAEPTVSVESRESYPSPEPSVGQPTLTGRELPPVEPDREFPSWAASSVRGARARILLPAGTALAVLVFALAYVAWRSTQATSGSSPAATQAPAVMRAQPVAPEPARSTAPLATGLAKAKPKQQAPPVNGSAELAMAQSYLNSTDGKERNGEEAAKWLWKAVAKRNADATLRLSDLYLKGDGVPKNCDQARVLLDAAARNGVKAAGERLSRLQSFGCE